MSHEKLDRLVKIGHLKVEAMSAKEIKGLIESGETRITDAKNQDLNINSRFDLAYNAAHAFSLAALRMAGYRSESRYIVFQCLCHTLDVPANKWRVLDQAHRERNLAEYQGQPITSKQLLKDLIQAAEEVGSLVSRNNS